MIVLVLTQADKRTVDIDLLQGDIQYLRKDVADDVEGSILLLFLLRLFFCLATLDAIVIRHDTVIGHIINILNPSSDLLPIKLSRNEHGKFLDKSPGLRDHVNGKLVLKVLLDFDELVVSMALELILIHKLARLVRNELGVGCDTVQRHDSDQTLLKWAILGENHDSVPCKNILRKAVLDLAKLHPLAMQFDLVILPADVLN